MIIKELDLPGIFYIIPTVFQDKRGYFFEIFKHTNFVLKNIELKNFVQFNESKSTKNVLRGLHFQNKPYEQCKLVKCTYGKIFDVIVDINKKSPNFGKWISKELSSDTNDLIYIPEGYAHGFCVLSEFAIVNYYCTNEYNKESENGIIWNDKNIGIKWPIENPIISDKDLKLKKLCEL
jgi:dTDP-4-dehydrorhamnose 3,5-epimerase